MCSIDITRPVEESLLKKTRCMYNHPVRYLYHQSAQRRCLGVGTIVRHMPHASRYIVSFCFVSQTALPRSDRPKHDGYSGSGLSSMV